MRLRAAAVVSVLGLLITSPAGAWSRISPAALDWDAEMAGYNLDPAVVTAATVGVCGEHFPVGSDARAQLEAAVAMYNDEPNAGIQLTIVEYPTHRQKSDFWRASPDFTITIDYTEAADTSSSACFAQTPTCDFTASVCLFDGAQWGLNVPNMPNGVVNLIDACFTQATDPYASLSDPNATVPKADLFSHEIGHLFGLRHLYDRPVTTEAFQGKMGDSIGQLSAYDVGFLNHHYPPASSAPTDRRISASTAIRWLQPDGTVNEGIHDDWATGNPANLYLENGVYLDCKTGAAPQFSAQLFDKGIGTSDNAVDVQFSVQSQRDQLFYVKHTETVPLYLSGAYVQMEVPFNQVDVTSDGLVLTEAEIGWAKNTEYITTTVRFEVDPGPGSLAGLDFPSVDMSVRLYADGADCPTNGKRVARVAGERHADDRYGAAVAARGYDSVVGAPGYDFDAAGLNLLSSAGAAWVYATGVDGNFPNKALLTAESFPAGRQAGDELGAAVAIDAEVIAVGAPRHAYDAGGANPLTGAGAVYLFKKVDTTWVPDVKLTGAAHRQADDRYGTSVALSEGGLWLAVGAPRQDTDGSGANPIADAGAVYLYERVSGVWTYRQKITAPSSANGRKAGDRFGWSVSLTKGIHPDRHYLAVGAPGQGFDAAGGAQTVNAGAAYVFKNTKNDPVFAFEAKLVGQGVNGRMANDELGRSISVYPVDGDRVRLAVGAPQQDFDAAGGAALADAGAVYRYARENEVWTFEQKMVGGPGFLDRRPGDRFGSSVSVYGQQIIVGAPNQSHLDTVASFRSEAGAAFVFSAATPSLWTVTMKAVGWGVNGRVAGDHFGTSVAASSQLLLAGAPDQDFDADGASSVSAAGNLFVGYR